MSAEPLHVRVARALGWTELRCFDGADGWTGRRPPEDFPPNSAPDPNRRHYQPPFDVVPPYGQDSPEGNAVTMPFLRYVSVAANGRPHTDIVLYNCNPQDPADQITGRGVTWGDALCNLVLALSEAGRLNGEPGPSDEAVR